jgi:hypothetical protein
MEVDKKHYSFSTITRQFSARFVHQAVKYEIIKIKMDFFVSVEL